MGGEWVIIPEEFRKAYIEGFKSRKGKPQAALRSIYGHVSGAHQWGICKETDSLKGVYAQTIHKARFLYDEDRDPAVSLFFKDNRRSVSFEIKYLDDILTFFRVAQVLEPSLNSRNLTDQLVELSVDYYIVNGYSYLDLFPAKGISIHPM